MRTIYDIKPMFQQILRPIVKQLHQRHITPNTVTLFAFALSIVYGLLLFLLPNSNIVLYILPIVLFIRMALNAIDGILAKEYQLKSPLGALLNELCDMGSDTVLYLPFAMIPGVNSMIVIFIVLLAIISEAAGLCGLLIGASRRYDGPMGKSDRAFVFSLIAIALAVFHHPIWINWVLFIIAILLLITIFNRCVQALKEIGHTHVIK